MASPCCTLIAAPAAASPPAATAPPPPPPPVACTKAICTQCQSHLQTPNTPLPPPLFHLPSTRRALCYFSLGHCPGWAFSFYFFLLSFGLLLCLIFMQFTCNLCPFRLLHANYLHFRFHLVQGGKEEEEERKAQGTKNSKQPAGGEGGWDRGQRQRQIN